MEYFVVILFYELMDRSQNPTGGDARRSTDKGLGRQLMTDD